MLKRFFRPFVAPSRRGKIRWALFGIIILALFAFGYDYAKPYNQAIGWVNARFAQVSATKDWRIPELPYRSFSLGLDLQGGAQLVYEGDLSKIETLDRSEAMERLRDRIERRVNALGVSEPRVQVSGQDRLVVELAGVNVDTAKERIGETPHLEFRETNDQPARELTAEEQKQIDEFNVAQKAKAESARQRLATGRESFEDLAKELSEDPQTKDNGGDLGEVTPATHRELIDAARKTIIGKVVPTVVETEDGFYVLRVDDRQENDVEMELSHILICYAGASGCIDQRNREEAQAQITKLAGEVTPANFAAKAKEVSDDPGAEVNSGNLGFIAPATLVKPFEDAAKPLKVGTISAPVETDYGFHLIYKRSERPYGVTKLHAIFFDKKQPADFLPDYEQYKPTGLSGTNVIDAQLAFDPQTNAPQVSIKFDDAGTKLFADLTRRNLGKQIAIYLDGHPISIPTVQVEIANGEAVITGQFGIEEARNLARQLKDGALPVSVSLIQQQTVGASLGAESLQKSLYAGLVGILLVMIFMVLYYRLLGVVALLGLAVYSVTGLLLFKLVGTTLTLSGIAGFLLSIGMAVDANVLIFERFREERVRGRELDESVEIAFTRAWPAIRDGNVSTLITCLILAYMGTSLIQGFAVTLGIGVMVSMFSAITVTRTILRLIIAWPLRRILFLFGSGLRPRG
ncbi:MAG: protein translocase subunit SecD [Parcubacteria group bacterium]|nr:protein translocase subunit SecD [Parcubacteria group bacterium]